MRVIIAGGGTGGHLFPGIAVARDIERRKPGSKILFVGAEQGIETRIVPKEGFELRTLPVGGIKEKILAAKRANIKEVILCKSNQKDINEIKGDYIKDMTFHYVTDMRQVIDLALLAQKVKDPLDLTVKDELKTVLN